MGFLDRWVAPPEPKDEALKQDIKLKPDTQLEQLRILVTASDQLKAKYPELEVDLYSPGTSALTIKLPEYTYQNQWCSATVTNPVVYIWYVDEEKHWRAYNTNIVTPHPVECFERELRRRRAEAEAFLRATIL